MNNGKPPMALQLQAQMLVTGRESRQVVACLIGRHELTKAIFLEGYSRLFTRECLNRAIPVPSRLEWLRACALVTPLADLLEVAIPTPQPGPKLVS